jgi:hypothetical protein
MRKEYGQYDPLGTEILRGYLKVFLLHLSRQYQRLAPQRQQPPKVALLKNFFTLLERDYTRKKRVKEAIFDSH